LWCLGLFDTATHIPALILVNARKPLPNGDTGYEVDPQTIQEYLTTPNAQAIWYWNKTRKHGKPPDWRNMTMQQLAVLELFDTLWDKRQEELIKFEEAKEKAKKGN